MEDLDINKRISPKTLKTLYKDCYIDRENGYWRFNDSGIYVHRWVMEKKLKRKLAPGEIVHHMNGNKLDNRPSNLMIFEDEEEHTEWHQEQLEVSGVW